MPFGYGDGCTGWFDGFWRHCCDAHDKAGLEAVTVFDWWQASKDLEDCVAAAGAPLMGFIMAAGTAVFGLVLFWLRRASDAKR